MLMTELNTRRNLRFGRESMCPHLDFQQVQLLVIEHLRAGLGLRLHLPTSRHRPGEVPRRLREQLLLLGEGGAIVLELFLRRCRRSTQLVRNDSGTSGINSRQRSG